MNQLKKAPREKPHLTVITRDVKTELEDVGAQLSRLEKLIHAYNLRDILMSVTNTRRLLWRNFIAGVARGLGLTVGTTVVLALFFLILREFISLPVIGDYIRGFMEMIRSFGGNRYGY
ncbi:DUF5665 domain-containing protein [Numidum massiliense]|uniref:DUF5665 domain-containing protein n=1 Tax=Numidum massiliense TaxID=1522315 RepID=UPI0006D5AD9A|nr:DUF5665 domain-containing protein [Numidum massiliense]